MTIADALENRILSRHERAMAGLPLFDETERDDELPLIPRHIPRHVLLREPWAYGHERHNAAGPVHAYPSEGAL